MLKQTRQHQDHQESVILSQEAKQFIQIGLSLNSPPQKIKEECAKKYGETRDNGALSVQQYRNLVLSQFQDLNEASFLIHPKLPSQIIAVESTNGKLKYMIISSGCSLDLLSQANTWVTDGTFNHIEGRDDIILTIIGCFPKSRFTPCVFILHSGRTEALYVDFLIRLKIEMSHFLPLVQVNTDFESGFF